MLSKLLLSLSLAVAPVVSVSAQVEYNEFDTFQSVEKYLQDFDYLNENSYRVSFADFRFGGFEFDYSGERFLFYVLPNYYDLSFVGFAPTIYYSNVDYNFFVTEYSDERFLEFDIINFIGQGSNFPYLALDYIGMSQVIEHDKVEKSNSISIYNSFYNFFTGFFPNEVVAEYHGIFTFVIVAFLLFLVFGFVFFLFRVIRRLVGFK